MRATRTVPRLIATLAVAAILAQGGATIEVDATGGSSVSPG